MVDINPKVDRPDRCPGISYTDMLAVDTRPAPDYLVMESNQELGDAAISMVCGWRTSSFGSTSSPSGKPPTMNRKRGDATDSL